MSMCELCACVQAPSWRTAVVYDCCARAQSDTYLALCLAGRKAPVVAALPMPLTTMHMLAGTYLVRSYGGVMYSAA